MNLFKFKKESSLKKSPAGIGQNLFWMVWSGVVGIANSVLIWMFLARLRETEELGRFTIVMGLYALFYSICSLGLMPYLVSEISRRIEQSKIFGKNRQPETIGFVSSASVFLTISAIVCAVLMSLASFWISESASVRISTVILSFAIIPSGAITVAESILISVGRTRLIAFATTLENVLRTVISAGLIWFDFSIAAICLSFAVVRILTLLVYLSAANRKILEFAFNAADFRKIAKVSPTFAGIIIFASINWQLAIILLGYFSTETESAKYGVASRFLIPVSILMASYANVIQPVIAQYIERAEENSGSYLSKMARYPLVLATLAAMISPLLSRQILTVLFGVKYADAAPVLDILALSIVPFCLVMIVARGLVATNSQHIDFIANALGVAACFIAGAILIPQYGAVGAATAQLISFLLMALVEISYLSKKFVGFNIWGTASFSMLSIVIIYGILWNH